VTRVYGYSENKYFNNTHPTESQITTIASPQTMPLMDRIHGKVR
jgi:hypothetical protein